MLSIALIGTGPTGLYTFAALTGQAARYRITLYEKGDTIGVGTPYSEETATKAMLANIASIEIPPLQGTYLEWLEAQPAAFLHRFGLRHDDLNARLFTPRLMLGAWFHAQFEALIVAAEAAGHEVVVHTGVEVTDLRLSDGGVMVEAGAAGAVFDRVILASGHSFAEDAQTARYFPNPWSGLIQTDVPAARVGVLGTSLSAIDAAMAVATQHGRFVRDGEALVYERREDGLQITLMSRSGVLPEADFYCPIPYAPLEVMTEAALTEALAAEAPLDAVFDLFRAEITAADPGYAAHVGLPELTADSFAAAYFADRLARDPFGWARENLAEVERDRAARRTVGWRYAILRMHETVEAVLAQLPEDDRARFDAGLKRVFIDNYAAVPPESIRRLLALRDAGALQVAALGEDYDLEIGEAGTVIRAKGRELAFDVFIDARGQRPMQAQDLPFAALRAALEAAEQEVPEVDEGYVLRGVAGYGGRVVLAALPYLMHDRPFVQGITASAEIGAAVAAGLEREEAAPRRRWRWAQMLDWAA